MSFFLHPADAARYRRARPYFHPYVAQRLAELIPPQASAATALDVGCGTGHSSEALAALGGSVVAIDTSLAMLREAQRRARLSYVAARAEELPCRRSAFGLVTVGLAFHWFDAGPFFEEAHRVLQPSGWLALYDDAFTGTTRDNAGFEDWWRTAYLARFPAPPRRRVADPTSISAPGFSLRHSERFRHTERFTLDRLVSYLMTQTNTLAAITGGAWTVEELSQRLRAELEPILGDRAYSFEFSGWISLLQRDAPQE